MVHTVLGTSYHDLPFYLKYQDWFDTLFQYASQKHTLRTEELGIDDIQRMNLISESILYVKEFWSETRVRMAHISLNVATNSVPLILSCSSWTLFTISFALPLIQAIICTLCLRAIWVHSSSVCLQKTDICPICCGLTPKLVHYVFWQNYSLWYCRNNVLKIQKSVSDISGMK